MTELVPIVSVNDFAGLARVTGPLHLAIGVFDGVHRGHQAVIERVVAAAAREGGVAGLVTFDPHPIQVIAPAKAPAKLLATLGHKQRIVRAFGVRLFAPLRFDQGMASLTAEGFLKQLALGEVRTIAVGEDWRFGHDRKGDVALLSAMSRELGYRLEAVAPFMHEGDRISSTRIRQAIGDGNLNAAAAMLGRAYSVSGEVVRGDQLGRQLGFPTANVDVAGQQLPPDGVWLVEAHQSGGELIRGVANLGVRPSVGCGERRLEVHLLDFSGDLYGRELTVRFLGFLRDERRFETLGDLQQAIRADQAAAGRWFSERRV